MKLERTREGRPESIEEPRNGGFAKADEPRELKYGLIGEHLGHSFSAEIHAALGNRDYQLCELAPDEVEGFIRGRRFKGINVTIPYKQTVMPYLDEIDPAALSIGAVNTLLCRDGRLIGYNTDFYGMRDLICRAGIDLGARSVAILGTGGTSKTALAVAQSLGAGEVVRVSRHPEGEGEISYDELKKRAGRVEVLINTTPLGMFPREDAMAVDPGDFPTLEGVVDVVYHPLKTQLVCRARSLGIRAVGGLYMLVSQAAHAAGLFFDDPDMPSQTDAVFRKILAQKQNTVLLGMPGSGKSTLGRLLSARQGKQFFDSDILFLERHGIAPGEFIRQFGEERFRDEESKILRETAAKSGCVIASGGGAVVRPDNVEVLRRNGVTVFLDRPIESITPTPDRPLSCDRAALERRYRERLPLYRAAADITLSVDSTPERAAENLMRLLDEYVARQ